MRLFVITLFLSSIARPQVRFDPDKPKQEEFRPTVAGISGRLAASDYVVIGTVTKLDLVKTRLYKQQLTQMENLANVGRDISAIWAASDWGTSLTLYSMTVESTLCRQSDFHPGQVAPREPSEIYFFSPVSPNLDAGHRDEVLRVGSRYLFFLGRDTEVSERLARFDLDLSQNYYRVLNHSDGAIELAQTNNGEPIKRDTDLSRPVVETATALCAAVQPTNAFQKIDALERLKSSPDLTMRENAEAAMKLIDPTRK